MLKKLFKNERGLTLVELLAVIVILGIIAGIAVPSVMNIIQKSRINAVKADALQVLSAAKTYAASNPDDVAITEFELEDYINKSKLDTTANLGTVADDDFTVAVTDNGQTFKLTSENISVSGVTVKFTGATPNGINSSDDYKGGTTKTITISN